MSNARAAAPADKEGERGRVAPAKVSRYWAGKRVDGPVQEPTAEERQSELFPSKASKEPEKQRTPAAPAVIVKHADPRLVRLARTDTAQAQGAGRHRHRKQIQEAQVVRKAERSEDTTQQVSPHDAEAQRDPLSGAHPQEAQAAKLDVAAERQARRERALQAQQEADKAEKESESEYETDDGSDEESDSSDDEQRMAKPVFVPKADRDTVLEKERAELEAMQLKEAEQKRVEARVKETADMVAAMVDQEKLSAATKDTRTLATASDIDTDDDTDEEDTEFELWRRRELDRIKREEVMRDPSTKEADDAKQVKAAKGKMKFMQKYYHKGAFFQSEADDDRATVGADAIYTRDYMGATGEDKFDKQALPAVMQVKNFGRSGRSKWTHLAAEDTTFAGQKRPGEDNDVFQVDNEPYVFKKVRQAVEAKGASRGEAENELARPTRTRT